MAHFYGDMKGNRGETTRCGTKNSGINAHIRGWTVGVEVTMYVNDEGKDEIRIYKTGGSKGYGGQLITTITEDTDDAENTVC